MAIVTFWSDSPKDTAQSTSALAIATYLAMERNMKILLIDANFSDETFTRARFHTDGSPLKRLPGNKPESLTRIGKIGWEI